MKKFIKPLIVLLLLLIAVVGATNVYTTKIGGEKLVATTINSSSSITVDELEKVKAFGADCILVLGAGVKADGTPSLVLQDRLDAAIWLYENHAAPKLLLTGDNGQVEYNEVKSMLEYVAKSGVPREDIFLDHAGFSTYESMYRAKEVFEVKKAIVITQRFHQYRALYDAIKLGLEVIGVATNQHEYPTIENKMNIREAGARVKDFMFCIAKPKPKYLGEPILIEGNGLKTQ